MRVSRNSTCSAGSPAARAVRCSSASAVAIRRSMWGGSADGSFISTRWASAMILTSSQLNPDGRDPLGKFRETAALAHDRIQLGEPRVMRGVGERDAELVPIFLKGEAIPLDG